jgi:autotransporter-associated beta strand protein
VTVAPLYIGKNVSTVGTLNQTGGTFQSGNFIRIGSSSGGTGVVNISAGSLTAGTVVEVGREGTGTLNVSGTATVTANGDGVQVGSLAGGFGTLNLNGGTVTTKRVSEAAGTVSTVNFNGGLLKAGTGANATFVGPIDTATILAGGAFIDTSGQNLSVTANLVGSGGLTKSGLGTLTISGTYSYTGNTTVSTGTLSLATSSLADSSTVNLAAGAVLNLPHGLTDVVASMVVAGTPLSIGIHDATTNPGVITGTGKIQVSGVVVSPYAAWIAGYPSIPLADRDPGDDPDKDGSTNAVEFALGGTPNNGSSNPKVYMLVADSSDVGTQNELLMTIAVRSGTPAFTGSPSPSATQDGVTYKVQGSLALNSFTTIAIPVNVVAPPAPNATPPAGYEYRTFSLSGSNGTPDKGFLRVSIENP